ncbi:HlyC/CorC family transporter [Hyphomicrobium sp.]|jgi:Mg2+/Co2+ transporter CorB|uniref:HlyC/CorC family transporter n=1 Tax=Hyphomicrobium sp. TaxID=82 RepID=UPI002CEC4D35|nr:HlyC/CorC family transporter [Hyphomicrobium sp.]HVZ04791.1 HlyC/CorC family transporter [Hyphomicrobium sp.]
MTIVLSLLAIIVLIFLSAFFNGAETSLTAASRARMHALEEDGNAGASVVNAVLSRPEKMIGTVLLGNTLVDVLASAMAANLAVELYGQVGVAYATVAITILIVIFAAVLPKTYALAYADRVALILAPPMRGLIYILTPFTRAIEFIVRNILKLTPGKADDAANILAAHEEIRGTIDLQAKEGTVAKGDAEMLGGILDLGDLQVADIMVHRTKMETVNADDPPAKILDQLMKSQYTRVPIWQEEPENIIGVLHTKDLLLALSRTDWNPESLDIMKSASEPWFVPDTTSVKDQLNQFLKKKMQMALVIDEYGEVQGLITLEDILEEIVGQITDEHDQPDSHIRVQSDGTVNVDGTVAIRDLNRHLDWDLPDDEATTIAGLVIHEAQTIPEPGQVFTFHGYRFEILRKSRNKITAIRIKPITAAKGKDSTPTVSRVRG